MKFSELLGEPEPEQERDLPDEAEPISVFAPVPVDTPPSEPAVQYPSRPPEPVAPRPAADLPPPPVPVVPIPPIPPAVPESTVMPEPAQPAPTGPRTGLAEINVRQAVAAPTVETPAADPLAHLEAVDDDLLPSSSRARR